METYEIEYARPLDNFSKIYLPCEKCEIPHVYFFILPSKDVQKCESLYFKSQSINVSQNIINPRNKPHDKVLYTKWSIDDREQIKKFILIYGYGRWKQIQKSSTSIGGKLSEKPKSELRSQGNAFLRSLAENVGGQQDLRQFLYTMVEEYPDDPYIQPDSKDWDQSTLKQRAIPYTKRLQLLYRIRILIKKFKAEQLKNINDGDKEKINWENLLNFLPNSLLYGQRPSVWWTKKHDVDLLRGVYKFGYANYQTIRHAKEYCFAELEKTNSYQSFPTSDTLTRRLKKLIQTIIKSEEDKGKIDFDITASSEDEEKGWSIQERQTLFKYLLNNGVPINNEGRNNWQEIKEKMRSIPNFENFDKSISQIEKMVQRIRTKCQELLVQQLDQEKEEKIDIKVEEEKKTEQQIQNELLKENSEIDEDEFTICQENAIKFNKTTNMLHFIRKSILSNNQQLFNNNIEDLKKKSEKMSKDHPAYIQHPEYVVEIQDLNLLNLISTYGFNALENLGEYPTYGLHNKNLSTQKCIDRLQWICDTFKEMKDKISNIKKRKNEKNYKEDLRKKTKFEISRDQTGNIVFPIQINASLKINDIGKICSLPTYHSEHNLFPIGFSSVRIHASMFTRGQRCEYTCEILEGPEGKPLYRVTSSEDPEHAIVRESSTGCWVYICQRVNDLQEHKKEKVTISGTERFGLLESNVIRLLEDLPGAELCRKYKFKFKNNNGKMYDDEDMSSEQDNNEN